MKIRQILIVIISILIFGFSIFLAMNMSKPKEIPKKSQEVNGAREVAYFIAENKEIQMKLRVFGRLLPVDKTEIFSEVTGLIQSMPKQIKEGVLFQQDELLLSVDDKEFLMNMKAAKSALLTSITQIMPDIKLDFPESKEQWEAYKRNFNMESVLGPLPQAKSEKEKDFIALKTIYNQFYNIKSLEEKWLKYRIVVPFTGLITESFVSKGGMVRAGQKLATIMNQNQFELQANIYQEDISYFRLGAKVALEEESTGKKYMGQVIRLGNTIDNKSQSLRIYIQVQGNDLRENMFLSGELNAVAMQNVIEVPRKLLVDEAFIYAITNENKIVLQPVLPLKFNEETVVLRNVPEGTVLLKDRFNGIYEGMLVSLKR